MWKQILFYALMIVFSPIWTILKLMGLNEVTQIFLFFIFAIPYAMTLFKVCQLRRGWIAVLIILVIGNIAALALGVYSS